jgi:hypothetical protein
MTNKSILLMVISALLVASIYSLSTFVVFAAPPRNGSEETCTTTFGKKGYTSTECCTTYYVNGKALKTPCVTTCKDNQLNTIDCKDFEKGPGALFPGATTGGGLSRGENTTNSNNNTTPLRLNATTSTNPNAVMGSNSTIQ